MAWLLAICGVFVCGSYEAPVLSDTGISEVCSSRRQYRDYTIDLYGVKDSTMSNSKCAMPSLPCLFSFTSGKNHFHEMNGDVGMAGWK